MNKTKVLLGLSGGVDSAVAALLLQKQGYEVIGAFMRCFSESKNKITGECPWIEDKISAQKIAAQLGIKFVELNYEKEYKKCVVDPMFKAYAKGITPNPDSLCNKTIKFPYLWKEAKKLKCDFIATGHYIKKVKNQLKIPKDKNKDQSYFLYELNQKDIRHTLFPIGDYTKEKVRQIAKKHNFHNYNKPGTKGICFVGNIDVKDFLQQKIKQKAGNILSPEGQIIGKHSGMQFFTIGERIGEDKNTQISHNYRNKVKTKIYVAAKNTRKNELIVAPQNHPALYKKQFAIKNINWIAKPKLPQKVRVRLRHLGQLLPGTIKKQSSKILIILNKPAFGVADGQSAVIYQKNIMLGGGEIGTRLSSD